MNYESKLCKLSDGENHKQRRLTIIDYENALPLGRIILLCYIAVVLIQGMSLLIFQSTCPRGARLC